MSARHLVYGVDLDGTLTLDTAWTEEDCLTVRPNTENIEKLNKLYGKHFIVLHTARRWELCPNTMEWVHRNGIKYHAVRFDKMPCDAVIDSDAITDFNFLDLDEPIKIKTNS